MSNLPCEGSSGWHTRPCSMVLWLMEEAQAVSWPGLFVLVQRLAPGCLEPESLRAWLADQWVASWCIEGPAETLSLQHQDLYKLQLYQDQQSPSQHC